MDTHSPIYHKCTTIAYYKDSPIRSADWDSPQGPTNTRPEQNSAWSKEGTTNYDSQKGL
jgi:hypothetical protein